MRTRRRPLPALIFVVLFLIAILLSSCSDQQTGIEWIGFHSLKGQIHPIESGTEVVGGLALIGGHVSNIRAQAAEQRRPEPLLFATNSTIHGSALAFLSRGGAIVEVLRGMGLDALFVDSREFSFGELRLRSLAESAGFPFVAANIVDESGEIPAYLRGYFLDPKGRTAYIGLASPLLLERNTPMFVGGLTILDPVQAIDRQVQALMLLDDPPERIVVMAVGYKVDPEQENDFVDRILGVEAVDLAVFGDRGAEYRPTEHRRVGERTVLVLYVNDAEFDLGRRVEHTRISADLSESVQTVLPVVNSQVAPDPSVSSAVFYSTASAQEMLREELTSTTAEIAHYRDRESPLGNFVVDLYRNFAQADIAILNSGALRNGFDAGPITIREVYEVMPFQGSLVTLEITGRKLLEVLKRSVAYRRSAQLANGFLQVSGMSFSILAGVEEDALDTESVRVAGRVLEPDRVYSLVTESFLADGGDGYVELETLPRDEELQVLNFALFVEGLRMRKGPIPVQLGRIRIVEAES